jgi:Concanavalin A-like lectin/glucanases superfamily
MVFYPGGIRSSNPVKPSTSSASGLWSITEQLQASYTGIWPAVSNPVGSINAIALVVAGGGAGGGWVNNINNGGGGGAGGLYYNSSLPINTGSNYTVTIGAGGAAASGTKGTNGSNSSITGTSINYTVIGGGAGGSSGDGNSGGSGGGGGGPTGTTAGGSAIQVSTFGYGAGNAGGAGTGGYYSGGGGGAAAAGSTYNGGNGLAYNFANGTSVYYAGGGAGWNTTGVAGTAGSGGGGVNSSPNGANNTGGGGGGVNNTSTGGNGGSGVTIISYPLPQQWTGGSVTNNNGTNVVHTFTSSGTLTALATPIDTYQPYNTLLLHADGTNGANNSVFLDSSGTVDLTKVPFANTYSDYFNGSSFYLTTPTSTNLNLGTNNFTIEGWFYSASISSTQLIIEKRTSGGFAAGDWGVLLLSSALTFFAYDYNSAGNAVLTSSTLSSNTWYHFAVVRNGSTTTLYINGSVAATVAASNITNNTNGLTIGTDVGSSTRWYFSGYLSNLRINNGTAVYTSTFTTPTAALSNIANTVFLTAQSSTIVDNSSSALTITNSGPVTTTSGPIVITKSGTPTQGTYSPFSTTGWSNYFNGTTDYITVQNTGSLNFSSGNFTIEAWIYLTSAATSRGIITKDWTSGITYMTWGLYINGSGYLVFTIGSGTSSSSGAQDFASSTVPSTNTWNHISVVKSGTTITLYLNGINIYSATQTGTIGGSTNNIRIGADNNPSSYFPGYISNVRVVSSALYTSNFTPSITPYTTTSTSNTILLTCNQNQFISANASVSNTGITTGGTPQVQPFSPFNPTAAYSNTVVGGSMYFNGSTDSLLLPTGSIDFLHKCTADWTIEFWFYSSSSSLQTIICSDADSSSTGITVCLSNGATNNIVVQIYRGSSGNSYQFNTGTIFSLNTWNHVVITYNQSGNAFAIYLNGISQSLTVSGTATYSSSGATYQPAVGRYQSGSGPGGYFIGYISNLRLVNGTRVYTSNFTPPTAPPTTIANTTLLLNATNAGIIDNTQKNELITIGNTSISTTQSKFGGSSMYFDGSSGYISIPTQSSTNTAPTAFGSGPYTVEAWIYFTGASQVGEYDIIDSTTGNFQFYIAGSSGGLLWGKYGVGGLGPIIAAGSIPTNTWTHIAISRVSTATNSTYAFVNGTLTVTTTDSNVYSGTNMTIGGRAGGSNYYTGYIDDLRITKGIARYTSNFTPSTSAFLNT